MNPPFERRKEERRFQTDDETGTWDQWRLLVLKEIKDLRDGVKDLDMKVTKIQIEQAQHRGRSSAFSAIAGAVGGALTAILANYFTKGGKG